MKTNDKKEKISNLMSLMFYISSWRLGFKKISQLGATDLHIMRDFECVV